MPGTRMPTFGRSLSEISDDKNTQSVGQGNAALRAQTAALLLHPFLDIGAQFVSGKILPPTNFIQPLPIGRLKTNLDVASRHNQRTRDQ